MREASPLFAFLIHARTADDFGRWKGSRLLRDHSDSDEDFLRKITTADPMVVGELTFGVGASHGELVGVMRLPHHMVDGDGRSAAEAAAEVAVARGARWIGLGALTAPATAAGLSVARLVPRGVTVTTGNAFTAHVTERNVAEVLERHALPADAHIAVLGATGSVGVACSALLLQRDRRLTLIGRTHERVRRTLGTLANRAVLGSGLELLADADVIVVLTSAESARLKPSHLKRGAVIIDVCQPSNVSRGQVAAFATRGITIYEGGLVEIPGYASSYDLDLPGRRTSFACLAETYLMAREGITEHSVGPANPEFSHRMARAAERHRVSTRPIEQLVGYDDIAPRSTA